MDSFLEDYWANHCLNVRLDQPPNGLKGLNGLNGSKGLNGLIGLNVPTGVVFSNQATGLPVVSIKLPSTYGPSQFKVVLLNIFPPSTNAIHLRSKSKK